MDHITTQHKRVDDDEFRVHGEGLTITISELYSGDALGSNHEEVKGDSVIFNPPLQVSCFKSDAEDSYSITFDFGLSHNESASATGAYGTPANASWVKKAIASARFDLRHAFFHTAMDPNYQPEHYALFGCLALNNRAQWKRGDGTIEPIFCLP